MKNSWLPARPSTHEHGAARFSPSAARTASGETERTASQQTGRGGVDKADSAMAVEAADAAAAAVNPLEDHQTTGEYRRDLVRAVVRRAFENSVP